MLFNVSVYHDAKGFTVYFLFYNHFDVLKRVNTLSKTILFADRFAVITGRSRRSSIRDNVSREKTTLDSFRVEPGGRILYSIIAYSLLHTILSLSLFRNATFVLFSGAEQGMLEIAGA